LLDDDVEFFWRAGGQFERPLKGSDGQLLAAGRAAPAFEMRFDRRFGNLAFPMAVEEVRSQLGDPLNRSLNRGSGQALERVCQPRVAQLTFEECAFPAKSSERSCGRRAHDLFAVKIAEAPAHSRVTGQTGLDPGNLVGQITKTLF
jgi:hypothetical protein